MLNIRLDEQTEAALAALGFDKDTIKVLEVSYAGNYKWDTLIQVEKPVKGASHHHDCYRGWLEHGKSVAGVEWYKLTDKGWLAVVSHRNEGGGAT